MADWRRLVDPAAAEEMGRAVGAAIGPRLPALLEHPETTVHRWLRDSVGVAWADVVDAACAHYRMAPLAPVSPEIHPETATHFRFLLGHLTRPERAAGPAPWVPVGSLGPLIVMGHWTPAAREIWGIPRDLIVPVLLDPDVYALALASAEEAVSKIAPHYQPDISVVDPLRDLPREPAARVLEALRWLATNAPMEPGEQGMVDSALTSQSLDPGALPAGYAAALDYLCDRHPAVPAEASSVQEDVLAQLTPMLCAKHRALPVFRTPATVYVAVPDPSNYAFEDEFVARCGAAHRLVMVRGDAARIAAVLEQRAHAAVGEPMEASVGGAYVGPEASMHLAPEEVGAISPNAIGTTTEDLLKWVLYHAIVKRASDIHVESFHGALRVRVRLDGALIPFLTASGDHIERMVGIIKNVASGMSINRNDAQDGRFSIGLGGRVVDARVSGIPWRRRFQKITIRLLDTSAACHNIGDLGLDKRQTEILLGAVAQPQGLIVVTGPTGSGKSTTLYAMLHELNRPDVNIQTIEDPIEFEIEGVNQTQVVESAGLNLGFASLLPRILRADPDVIMVGEARDPDTAIAAVNAALTGHLVLTTLHSLDAIRSVGRLLSMGVPPFLLADSLLLLQAQRLIRRVCRCAKIVPTGERQREAFARAGFAPGAVPESMAVRHGCRECNNTGYRGRMAVMELCPISPELREMINRGATTADMEAEAARAGHRPMLADALGKVAAGITTFSEALTVVTSGGG